MFEQLTPRLPVRDLSATRRFYEGRLGFSPSVLWPEEEPTLAILERDSTTVGFFIRDSGSKNSVEAVEIYIRVADVMGLHSRLAEAIPVEWGPEIYSYGCREFAVRDPDGYLIIFTEPTDEPPTTDEPEA